MRPTFSILNGADHRDLAALVCIYQQAIDPSEQKKPAEISAMLADPNYSFTVCKHGEQVVGFSIAFFPEAADFWLLEYMAVAELARGQRLGEALFHQAYANGLKRDPARVCVLEVDQPRASSNVHNDTLGRVRFYKRLGCRALHGLDYILPLESGGTPPPMMLLTYREPPLDHVGRQQVRGWLTTLYVEVYNQSAEDPRIIQMLSRLGPSLPVVAL